MQKKVSREIPPFLPGLKTEVSQRQSDEQHPLDKEHLTDTGQR